LPGAFGLPQEPNGDAVDHHGSGVLVDVVDHRFGPVAMKKGMQGAVGRVPFQVVGDVRQGGACLPADIDDDFTEVSPSDMMPDAKFADAAKAIDTDFQLSFIHFCLASGLMGLGSMSFRFPGSS
jgi:hypothetical protein